MAAMNPAQGRKGGPHYLQSLDGQEHVLEARLNHLRATRKLYEALGEDQKAIAEELLTAHASMNVSGMMPMGQ